MSNLSFVTFFYYILATNALLMLIIFRFSNIVGRQASGVIALTNLTGNDMSDYNCSSARLFLFALMNIAMKKPGLYCRGTRLEQAHNTSTKLICNIERCL